MENYSSPYAISNRMLRLNYINVANLYYLQ